MILVGFVLGVLTVLFLRALVAHRPQDVDERKAKPAPQRRGQTGRAVLKAYRVYGDVRAISRGTYGRRLVRRAAFRGLGRL